MKKTTVIWIAAMILSLSVGTAICAATNGDKYETVVEYDGAPQLAPMNPDFVAYWESPLKTSYDHNYGYIPPPIDLSHLDRLPVKRLLAPTSYALPSSFDWRDSGNVTPVKNQDSCGTCWIFGTASVLESAVLMGESTECDFSEQSVALCVDRSWVYLYDGSIDPCHAGGWGWLASEVFIKKGAVPESCNPYNCSALYCGGSCVCDDCQPVKRVDGYRLATNDGSEIDVIKNAVYDHGPVTVAFKTGSLYLRPTYGYIYDYYPCSVDPTHMLSIIGWDDDVPHPNPGHSGTGAWILKNSWGTGWGNNGFVYLAYESNCVEEVAYLEYKDHDPDEELLYWDEAGFVYAFGHGNEDAWMASVFTANQSGDLTHTDFWTTSSNAQYEIYVWNGFFGTELANQTGNCSEMGYYSIPMSSSISIDEGQQFTVGVKMTTPGYDFPIATEGKISGWVEPDIQFGVSFVWNVSSNSWDDLAYSIPNLGLNACLRARIVNEPPGICGDVDGSGVVNILDVRLLLNHVCHPTGHPVDPCAGNVNGEDGIDMADVHLLLAYVFDPAGHLLTCG
jgi:C1A family cysteine protease